MVDLLFTFNPNLIHHRGQEFPNPEEDLIRLLYPGEVPRLVLSLSGRALLECPLVGMMYLVIPAKDPVTIDNSRVSGYDSWRFRGSCRHRKSAEQRK